MHFNQRPLILEIQEKPLQLPQKFLYLWGIHDKLENPEGEERALQNTSFKLINGYCFYKTKTVKINCGVSMDISVSSFDVLINCIIRYRNLNPLWSWLRALSFWVTEKKNVNPQFFLLATLHCMGKLPCTAGCDGTVKLAGCDEIRSAPLFIPRCQQSAWPWPHPYLRFGQKILINSL